jgi:hypothetical protein
VTELVALTFTNKAADEMKIRGAARGPGVHPTLPLGKRGDRFSR